MKKYCKSFIVLCCAGFFFFFALPGAMAQSNDPRLDNPRIEKDLKNSPKMIDASKLKKNPEKEDEAIPERPKPKAAAPGIKPIHDAPGADVPVPQNRIRKPNDPDRPKPLSADGKHHKKVHVSGKKPGKKLKHSGVMRSGSKSHKIHRLCQSDPATCMQCCMDIHKSKEEQDAKMGCNRICNNSGK